MTDTGPRHFYTNMHSFLLTLTKTDARLALLQEGKVVAEKSWAESRDMGRQLFEAIRDLLAEARLEPAQVTDFRLETGVSDNFTPLDDHPSESFWHAARVAPSLDNPENKPLLSDLTGLTSVKIAQTVAQVYNWSVSVQAKTTKNS